jgi:hypothetical protein
MKITIDTKQDTHEDIKKVIRLLTHLIGDHPTTNQPNLFEDSASPPENVFGNIFNNPESKENKEEIKTDMPEIIPY